MARKIDWNSPDDTTVTKVEISSSKAQYGTYVVASTINATSDGSAKSSSNTWVTNYTDSSGATSDWYKIRFAIGTASYSDYSDPVTSEERVQLCTVDDIKKVIDVTGRWTDDEIFDVIVEVDEVIKAECGTPVQSMWTETGKINSTLQELYFLGEENIYRVDRVFYGTTTKTEIFLEDGYKVNEPHGMLRFITTGTWAVTLDSDKDVEVQYVPMIFHKMSLYRTCKALLEKVDATSGGKVSKELTVIDSKLAVIEQVVINRVGLQLSGDLEGYNKTYGVNLKKVIQDHSRNRYLASTGIVGW